MKSLITLFACCLSVAAATPVDTIPFQTMDGKKQTLADYEGKVVLLVNTASECGLTKQYGALEKIYDQYKDKSFVILAFPCNDFGQQEPGTHEEIAAFCEKNFGVSFPLMAKIHVKGDDQHPLYARLTQKGSEFPGKIKWNFEKFLISKDGKVVSRFSPRTKPDDAKVTKAIETALAEK